MKRITTNNVSDLNRKESEKVFKYIITFAIFLIYISLIGLLIIEVLENV